MATVTIGILCDTCNWRNGDTCPIHGTKENNVNCDAYNQSFEDLVKLILLKGYGISPT